MERQHTHAPRGENRQPISTYRLQLQPEFGFADAEAALPVLERLGVTDLYLSPILQAAAGSTHGYDVVDHTVINRELGGRAGFESLARAAHARGMGVIVDVVPNHMAVPSPLWQNRAMWSVLRDGEDSPFASWFDGSVHEEGILMAVLGERVGTAIAKGTIGLEQLTVPGEAEPSWVLRYHENVFPVKPGTEQLPLAHLLESQHYRLAYWKVADEELNYRRFFDVGSLAAVRVEDRDVFDATHALLFELFHDGHIDGFRIDHPDGLADPRGYFRWLDEATGGAWVVAEKILEADEELQDDWPVAGTTGYDAAWRIGSLFVDPSGGLPLTQLANQATGSTETLQGEITKAKRQMATTSLFTEIQRLTTIASSICHDDIRLRDHTKRAFQATITELVIAVDRYRAYVVPGETAPGSEEAVIRRAAAIAAARLADDDLIETLDVVVDLVLGREVGSAGRQHEERRGEFIVRFQQVTGAVTAKGVEDTAYYRWTPLVSLTEVGGAPDTFGTTPDDLHAWCTRISAAWPATMTLLSTHDTKRSEDVRARINVISEYPAEWIQLATTLKPRAAQVEGHTRNLLWQILWGTWQDGPIEPDRLTRYMLKAAKEQKLWTTWTNPDVAGEAALTAICEALVADPEVRALLTDFARLTAREVRTNVLGQKAIQLTAPGVADLYQGSERLSNRLVDPDNRAPFDVAGLDAALDATHGERTLQDEKLALVTAILQLRRQVPDAFVGPEAHYRPLAASTGNVLAFSRGSIPRVVTVASRLTRRVFERGGFGEHTVVLPQGEWTDIITGTTFDNTARLVSDILTTSPVAVLKRVE